MDSGTGDRTFCTHATPRLALGWPGLYISPTPETNRPNDQETNVASAAVCSLIERVYVRRRPPEPLRCLPASLPRFASPCWSNPHTLGLMGQGRTARGHGNRVHSRDSPNKEPSGPCFAGTVVRCSNPEATTNSAPRAGIAACPANSTRRQGQQPNITYLRMGKAKPQLPWQQLSGVRHSLADGTWLVCTVKADRMEFEIESQIEDGTRKLP